jgi:Arc/MetJ-type ribon-helix-helix transcriptional regulator
MAKGRRVVFTFDERSLESLRRLAEQGQFPSMADAVRDALRVRRALQQQAEQGYIECIVRNPKSGQERVLLIPTNEPIDE